MRRSGLSINYGGLAFAEKRVRSSSAFVCVTVDRSLCSASAQFFGSLSTLAFDGISTSLFGLQFICANFAGDQNLIEHFNVVIFVHYMMPSNLKSNNRQNVPIVFSTFLSAFVFVSYQQSSPHSTPFLAQNRFLFRFRWVEK